jgi:hypothetical protein
MPLDQRSIGRPCGQGQRLDGVAGHAQRQPSPGATSFTTDSITWAL